MIYKINLLKKIQTLAKVKQSKQIRKSLAKIELDKSKSLRQKKQGFQ
jgi:hypothetical protein